MPRLPMRRLPVWLVGLRRLRRLRLGLLPVLGLRLSLVLDQTPELRSTESYGRVLLDPAHLSYLQRH
jgi:hypothetical protein